MQKRMDEHLPELKEKFEAFREKTFTGQGALAEVTKHLIAVAVAAAARNNSVKAAHAEQARRLGAGEEQIAEALAVLWGQAGGTQIYWMKDDFGELLGANWRREFIPEADRSFWAFKREIFADGAIPSRIKQLIAAVVSSKLRCRHCTAAHIEAAFKAGASKAEVAEALGVLWAVASESELTAV